MLRISIDTNSDKSIRLSIEGWLVGPWVEELRQQSEQALAKSPRVALDLGKLLFVDPHGAALLKQLAERQVEHLNCSTFISRQLEETTQS